MVLIRKGTTRRGHARWGHGDDEWRCRRRFLMVDIDGQHLCIERECDLWGHIILNDCLFFFFLFFFLLLYLITLFFRFLFWYAFFDIFFFFWYLTFFWFGNNECIGKCDCDCNNNGNDGARDCNDDNNDDDNGGCGGEFRLCRRRYIGPENGSVGIVVSYDASMFSSLQYDFCSTGPAPPAATRWAGDWTPPAPVPRDFDWVRSKFRRASPLATMVWI